MSGQSVIEGSSDNWEAEVLKSAMPVLVDFWAEWCGPCRMIAPVLEELAAEMAGQIKIVKVNVDNNQNLAANYHIRSIPTLLIFKGGVVQAQMVGAQRKADLKEKLAAYL